MDPRAFANHNRKPKNRRKPACDVCGILCISTPALAKHRKEHTPAELKAAYLHPVKPDIPNRQDPAATAIQNILEKRRAKLVDLDSPRTSPNTTGSSGQH